MDRGEEVTRDASNTQRSRLSTSNSGTPETLTKIVRRTVAGRGEQTVESLVEEESHGLPAIANSMLVSARNLFRAATEFVGSDESEVSESDAVLLSTTRPRTADATFQVRSNIETE